MNKLKLNKESLKNLSQSESSDVHGGEDSPNTNRYYCGTIYCKTRLEYTCQGPDKSHAFICQSMHLCEEA